MPKQPSWHRPGLVTSGYRDQAPIRMNAEEAVTLRGHWEIKSALDDALTDEEQQSDFK